MTNLSLIICLWSGDFQVSNLYHDVERRAHSRRLDFTCHASYGMGVLKTASYCQRTLHPLYRTCRA